MDKRITADMGILELGSLVCSELEKHDVHVVLSGGACMELYSKKFSSYDIDLIERYSSQHKKITQVMIALGFVLKDKYFKHENNPYMIEFPTGPVTVGDEFVKEVAVIETDFGCLKLLSPTDCVKDRLCAWIYHYDDECLDQAVDVAKNNAIDYENLRTWAESEAGNSMKNGYQKFIYELSR